MVAPAAALRVPATWRRSWNVQLDAGVGAGLAPDPPPRHFGRRVTGALCGEHQIVGSGPDEPVEVGAQLVDQQLRQRQGADAGHGLRVLEDHALALGVDSGSFDGDGGWVGVQVEMSASQAEALALAESGEGGEQHHGPEPRCDGVGQAGHLLEAGDLALPAVLGRGAFEPARVAPGSVGHRRPPA